MNIFYSPWLTLRLTLRTLYIPAIFSYVPSWSTYLYIVLCLYGRPRWGNFDNSNAATRCTKKQMKRRLGSKEVTNWRQVSSAKNEAKSEELHFILEVIFAIYLFLAHESYLPVCVSAILYNWTHFIWTWQNFLKTNFVEIEKYPKFLPIALFLLKLSSTIKCLNYHTNFKISI